MANWIPGINVRNLASTIRNPFGGDRDIIDGVSVRGGARTSSGVVGRTLPRSSAQPGIYANKPSSFASNPQNDANVAYTTGNTGGTYNAQAAAQAAARNDAILAIEDQMRVNQDALGRLGNQRNIGLSNISNSYNSAINKLTGQKAIAERDYNTQKEETGVDYTNTRADIRGDARNQYNSLRRLLGAAGAGASSAYNTLTGYATAQNASKRYGQTQDQYARNQRSMDTAWGDTQRGFKDYETELAEDRRRKENELQAGLSQTEASLNDTLANLAIQRRQAEGADYATARSAAEGYRSRISDLLNAIDNYGRQYANPVLVQKNIKYTPAELAAYQYDAFGTPQAQAGPAAGIARPFLSLLQREDEEERRAV